MRRAIIGEGVDLASRAHWKAEECIADVERELAAAGVIEPLALGGRGEATWADLDLASFAENRLGDETDPRTLDHRRRADWIERAVDEPPLRPSRRAELDTCHWLLDRGERAGTIALASSLQGGRFVRVSSLYVLPVHRGRSIAIGTLRRLRDALGKRDLGLKLSTCWSWQRAVRFYVRAGLWVHMWKRDLEFRWDALVPPPLVEVGAGKATLRVEHHSRRVTLCDATRAGSRLAFRERAAHPKGDPLIDDLSWEAPSTLAIALALAGWPLVRSQEAWEKYRASDAMAPESLADKIVIWEAWDRKHGWRVDAPRIAGLAYLAWDELEARWKAHEAGVAR